METYHWPFATTGALVNVIFLNQEAAFYTLAGPLSEALNAKLDLLSTLIHFTRQESNLKLVTIAIQRSYMLKKLMEFDLLS